MSKSVNVCLFICLVFLSIKFIELNRFKKFIIKVVVVSGIILNRVKFDIIIRLNLKLFKVCRSVVKLRSVNMGRSVFSSILCYFFDVCDLY